MNSKRTLFTSFTLRNTLAVLIGLGICSSSNARCAFEPVQNGFLHADQHLPANAKGILFRHVGPLGIYKLRNNKIAEFKFVLLVPPALSANDFSIEEQPGGKKLKASVTRLPLGKQLGLPEHNYFASKNSRLNKCAAENLFSLDGCDEIEGKVEKFISDGVLYEATQDLEKAYGTFRVSTEEGFVPGKKYVVRYSGPLKDTEGMRYLRSTNVAIDRNPVVPLKKDEVMLVIDKTIVKYKLPEPIEPYRDFTNFYTMLSLKNGTKPFVQLRELEATLSIKAMGQYCGSRSPLGKDRAWGEYDSRLVEECHIAKGYVGFLEIEDSLLESQVLRVNCR